MKFLYKILIWSILAYSSLSLRGQGSFTLHGAYLSIDSGTHVETMGGMDVDAGTILLNGNLSLADHLTNKGNGTLFHPDSQGLLVAESTVQAFQLSGQPIWVPDLQVKGEYGLLLENDLVIQHRLRLDQSVLDLHQHTLTFLDPEQNENPFPDKEGFFWNGTLRYKAINGNLRIPAGDGQQQQLLELQIDAHPEHAVIDVSWKDTALHVPNPLELEQRVVLGTALPGYWSLESDSEETWEINTRATFHNQQFSNAPASDFLLIHFQEHKWQTLGTAISNQNAWAGSTSLTVNHKAIHTLGNWVLVQTREKSTTANDEMASAPGIQSVRWVNNELEVFFLSEVEQIQLHLSDLRGSILVHQKFAATQTVRMNLPQLPDGVYLLSCSSPGKKTITYKIFHSQ